MRVAVFVKRVPSPGARINVSADGRAVDTTNLGFTISPHEECAVEAAVRLVENHSGHSTVLALGPPAAAEQLRHAISVGIGTAVLLPIEGPDWDPQRTASAIAAATVELEAADGPFDVLLFGNESADSGGCQVGVRVAHALGRPIVVGAKALEVVDAHVWVRRKGPSGGETYVLPLPAAVAVKEGINAPRYPTMRGRLAARNAAVVEIEPVAPAGGMHLLRLEYAPERATTTVVLGHGPDAAPAVVDLLEDILR
jgi:electron transfer flavoprotein beta subunit